MGFRASYIRGLMYYQTAHKNRHIHTFRRTCNTQVCNTGNKTLTHWGRDKLATNFPTTFSNAYPWTKTFKFWFKFHWNIFPRVQRYVSISSDNGMTPNRWQAMSWNNDGLEYQSIDASRSLNKLRYLISYKIYMNFYTFLTWCRIDWQKESK